MITRIGLTGGIGSGKSTVAAEFVACGAWLVDTDAIARSLTEPGGAALPVIVDTFGPGMVDARGALDRDRMRNLVFEDPAAKLRLEALLHPMIGQEADRCAAQAAGRPVVFDVPLLTERPHWRHRVERVVVVDCPVATQVARVVARSGWTAEAVQRVVDQQASRVQRRRIADAVIHNDGAMTLGALRDAARTLWHAWVAATPVEQ